MSLLDELRQAISRHTFAHPQARPAPVEPISPSDHPDPRLRNRQVACVVMAGGQATRLGSPVPKGVMPFSPIAGKPLLQLFAERIAAFGTCYNTRSRLAVMTSEGTDRTTRQLFETHQQFGVDSVDFFLQSALPLLDMETNPIQDSEGKMVTGPDGNGGVFRRLAEAGVLKKWKEEGVEAICVIMVDNPLLDPLCPALLTPIFEGIDVTAGAIERLSPQEQVGLFVEEEGKIRVVEYTELNPSLREQKDNQGHLFFRWANISAFGCSVEFVERAATLPLPLHAAKKTVNGKQVWKGEYFIFDTLLAARTIRLVPLNRDRSFAPVKDPISFKAAQAALQAKEKIRYTELTGHSPEGPLELPAAAWYPTEPFLKWIRTCPTRSGMVAYEGKLLPD